MKNTDNEIRDAIVIEQIQFIMILLMIFLAPKDAPVKTVVAYDSVMMKVYEIGIPIIFAIINMTSLERVIEQRLNIKACKTHLLKARKNCAFVNTAIRMFMTDLINKSDNIIIRKPLELSQKTSEESVYHPTEYITIDHQLNKKYLLKKHLAKESSITKIIKGNFKKYL